MPTAGRDFRFVRRPMCGFNAVVGRETTKRGRKSAVNRDDSGLSHACRTPCTRTAVRDGTRAVLRPRRLDNYARVIRPRDIRRYDRRRSMRIRRKLRAAVYFLFALRRRPAVASRRSLTCRPRAVRTFRNAIKTATYVKSTPQSLRDLPKSFRRIPVAL